MQKIIKACQNFHSLCRLTLKNCDVIALEVAELPLAHWKKKKKKEVEEEEVELGRHLL